MEKSLSVEEMKRIAHQIYEEEKGNLYYKKSKIFPITVIEYFKEYIPRNFKLTSIFPLALEPIISKGFNDTDGSIIIFLNNIKKIRKDCNKVFSLAEVCYHELRHSAQYNKSFSDYQVFLRHIDEYRMEDKVDYLENHDNFSFEVGANLYGVIKAKEYMQKWYPKLYEEQKGGIEKLLRMYQLDYMMYDASYSFDIAFKLLMKRKESIDVIFGLDIFLNDDYSFKGINEIINNIYYKSLDKKIIYTIFSSKSFLEQINIEELSILELSLLSDSLEYTKTIYRNQIKVLENAFKDKRISYIEFLKKKRGLLKKISIMDKRYILKIRDLINKIKSEENNDKLNRGR